MFTATALSTTRRLGGMASFHTVQQRCATVPMLRNVLNGTAATVTRTLPSAVIRVNHIATVTRCSRHVAGLSSRVLTSGVHATRAVTSTATRKVGGKVSYTTSGPAVTKAAASSSAVPARRAGSLIASTRPSTKRLPWTNMFVRRRTSAPCMQAASAASAIAHAGGFGIAGPGMAAAAALTRSAVRIAPRSSMRHTWRRCVAVWQKAFPTGMVPGFGKGVSLFPLKTIHVRHAIVCGAIIAACKTGGVDLVIQLVREGKSLSDVDWKRFSVFTLFGLGYLGYFVYFLYVPLLSRVLFPNAAKFAAKSLRQKLADRAGAKAVGKQVGLELFVHEPFLYFPAFYMLKEYVMTDGKEGWISRALQRYRKNCVTDVLACWAVFGPAFIINFSFCPLWARVPVVALVSVVWTAILSTMRGNDGAEAKNVEVEEVDVTYTPTLPTTTIVSSPVTFTGNTTPFVNVSGTSL